MARLLLIDVPHDLHSVLEQQHVILTDDQLPHDLVVLGSPHITHTREFEGPTILLVEPKQLPLLTDSLSRCDDFIVPPNSPQEMLFRISSVLARSAQRDLQLEEIRSDMGRDPLTRLINRTLFEETVSRTLSQSARSKAETSLCMLDIDYFKKVNDTHGHLAGDAAIVGVVEQCKNRLRQHDVVSRFGGDEIVILLPETTCDQALNVASQLCERVEATSIPFEGKALSITLSIGVASLAASTLESNRDWHSDYETLLAAADQALYTAKEAGRNCARSAQKESPTAEGLR